MIRRGDGVKDSRAEVEGEVGGGRVVGERGQEEVSAERVAVAGLSNVAGMGGEGDMGGAAMVLGGRAGVRRGRETRESK